MIDITEEFTNHVQTGLDILLKDFPHDRGSAVEEITFGRDAREQIRAWHVKFSTILDALDMQEQALRIMPYATPGSHFGEPAYDLDGFQVPVEVVDDFTDSEFRQVCHRMLLWDTGLPNEDILNRKTSKFYAAVSAVRDGKAERPVPIV